MSKADSSRYNIASIPILIQKNYCYLIAHYQHHVDSDCKEGQEIPDSPSTTIDEVLARSPDTPLTPQEMKLTTSLVRRRLSEDPNGILQMKTGGQVLHLL